MLSSDKLKLLSSICDAFVPSIEGEGRAPEFYLRPATAVGVDKVLAEIVETRLPARTKAQFHTLLKAMDSRLYNLVLTGRPTRFTALDEEERAAYLRGWRDSRIRDKRMGFQALKRFACFLYYSVTDEAGANPSWPAIGFVRPKHARAEHPSDLRIVPLAPEQNEVLDCDACVIGSGAGGSVIAYELSKAGMRVIVVEEGEYRTSESFGQEEFSMTDLRPTVFHDYSDALTADLSFIMLAGRGAGGGTILNWNTSLRPPKFVLDEWERDYGIQVSGSEFQSYLDEVWRVLRISTDESQANFNNEVLRKGCLELGYREGVDFRTIARNAVGCDQRCDLCTFGCAYSCKQSTIMNYLPMAFRLGAGFLFNAKAERVLIGEGKAKGVECSVGKKSVTVKARVVVAACGALNTPALLLKSGVNGKNVGRHLRLHPTTAVLACFDREVDAWRGPPQTVEVSRFLNLDGTGHGFWLEAVPIYPGLAAMSLPWEGGKEHKEFMLEKFRKTAATIILLREWGGGTVSVDRHGSPLVTYPLDSRDKSNMVRGIKEAARILAASGAKEIMTLHSAYTGVKGEVGIGPKEMVAFEKAVNDRGIGPNRMMLFSAHLMGSCRMSADESNGAAKPTGEVYGVENLFIGDASVFPTDLGVNPMVTIMGMAKRTAAFVLQKLGR